MSYVYLAQNVDDSGSGPCSQLVHSTWTSTEVRGGRAFQEVVPWSLRPSAWSRLSQGRPHEFEPDRLEAAERVTYESADIEAELDLPVSVGGSWWGTLGFVDLKARRSWPERDARLLFTVAGMVGMRLEHSQSQSRLEDLIRSQGDLIASVSHELRTPLAAIVGFAHELHESLDSLQREEVIELAGIIADQSTELANIVEDLLVAARSDIEALAIVPDEIDVRLEIERVVSTLRQTDLATGTVHLPGETTLAWADKLRFRQIVRNLVTNALRHGGDNIHLTVRYSNGHVRVLVSDDGLGVPETESEAIFEPYRGSSGRGATPGSIGLGLAISQKLARLMDGDLTYRRENSQSVFELNLPAARRSPSRREDQP